MFISSSIWILLRRILSNILDIMGKRLIGLYDVTIWGFTRYVDHNYLGECPLYWEVGKPEYTIIDCG